jgi:phenylpropionate dioxygenase-like ring-hydroxylating dioxygenase large terminal subunit
MLETETPRQSPVIAPGSADYPLNQWYVAAYSDEVTRTPFHRWLLDRPVLFYRDETGAPVALYDRCPHRGYPLSAGKLVGDFIQCGYHGLQFGRDGTCQLIPSGGIVAPGLRVDSYPVVERWRWIWLWAGDPQRADPGLIPDHEAFGLGKAGWHAEPAVLLEIAANYLLPFENLLDASHITFLHHGQIDAGDVAGQPLILEGGGREVRVVRRIVNELQSPLTMKTFGFGGTHAHRTITAEAIAPHLCGIRVDVEPVDESAMAQTNQLVVGITPRTRSTSYEFTAVAQTFPFVNPDWKADMRNLLMEDVDAMAKVQELHDRLRPDQRPETGLRADRGLFRARAIIAGMLREERA